jgi:hypothetical protein
MVIIKSSKTFTVGDYQEFKKATAPDSGDQEENDSAVDPTAIKTDWTSQQVQDFLKWENASDAEYSYSFLTKAELQDASDKGILIESFPDQLSKQWISENGEDLLLVDSSEDIGVLSLRQNPKIPPASSRNDSSTDSSNHSAQQNNISSTSATKPAGKSTTWFTTRNVLIACGVLLLCAAIAFVALGSLTFISLTEVEGEEVIFTYTTGRNPWINAPISVPTTNRILPLASRVYVQNESFRVGGAAQLYDLIQSFWRSC